MSIQSVRTAGPASEQFAGPGPARTMKRLFHATRPKFFPASFLPVLVGTAWGVAAAGMLDGVVFAFALVATLCVHAGANVLNDVGDEDVGTDRINADRIYPYTGGSQFIQSGILTKHKMSRLGAGLIAVAAASGVVLLLLEGPVILAFGFAGVSLAVLYSIGPLRLSSLGLGEAAVAIGFGVLPVTGAAWLQSGVVDLDVILFSLPVSAWVAAILLINEVPDIAADAATGKRTLPVRLGRDGTSVLYFALHATAALAVVILTLEGSLPLAAPLVPLALLVLAYRARAAIRRGVDDRAALTGAIETTLAIHTTGCLWLIAVVLLHAWTGA